MLFQSQAHLIGLIVFFTSDIQVTICPPLGLFTILRASLSAMLAGEDYWGSLSTSFGCLQKHGFWLSAHSFCLQNIAVAGKT